MTIMSSFCVTIRPRWAAGDISARYTGTITDAPPTARPRTVRAATSSSVVGAREQAMVETAKMRASTMMVLRRPKRSDSRPAVMAPNAAPNRRVDVTSPSVSGVSPRSRCMNGRAPLMTPVS